MALMQSMHLCVLLVLVTTTVSIRSTQEQDPIAEDAALTASFPKCPSDVFKFCSHGDLADHGIACIASKEATPRRAEEVQCVPKHNNRDGKYACPKKLAFKCDATPALTVVPLLPARQMHNFMALDSQDLALPLYCGLTQMALNKIANQPLTKDLGVSIDLPFWKGYNTYNLALDSFELGSVMVERCDAHVSKVEDELLVNVSRLRAEVLTLGWATHREQWPHMPENGTIQNGTLGASFNISLDLAKEEETSLDFSLDQIDINLGIDGRQWVSDNMAKLLKLARPVVSKGLQLAARVEIGKALEIVRTQGGCALLQQGLGLLAPVSLHFESQEPLKYHVPLVGNVLTTINSTSIELPKSMTCMRAEFNGTAIDFHIDDFEFGATFDWAYRKENSTFWHNNGTSRVHSKIGIVLKVDLENPDATDARVALPVMDFNLTSEYEPWFYSNLPKIVSPFIREAVNVLGSHFATYEIKKVLKEQFIPA
eukprot:TRINITY_DN12119_c0_g1_i1.p1 TRINITY_DN12119_c0_g1~~TRINITY_DN12119_c0_g1_i1.p1  ORF type:complete len:505 (-),score=97.61 TRINITY_DN12119_c0_g1_i1:61-1509(-)